MEMEMRRRYGRSAVLYGAFPTSETALDFHYFRRRIRAPMAPGYWFTYGWDRLRRSIYAGTWRQWHGRWKLRVTISWYGRGRKCLCRVYRKQPWRLLPGAATRRQRYHFAR